MADDTQPAPDVFHAGEREIQERAGVRDVAARLGPQMVRPRIDRDMAGFLGAQYVVIVASVAPDDVVHVSVLFGRPGFAGAASPTLVLVRAAIDDADPLAAALAEGPAPVGLLALDPMSRSRIRLNGTGTRTGEGLRVDLREVFGNCPKYIQRREPVQVVPPGDSPAPRRGTRLDDDQRALVRAADTCFVGSRHPERGTDASHRGGRPGFVAVSEDGSRLTLPDYHGNNMFQTLGNLTVAPEFGLLFVDWRTGRTLQVSGLASVVWDPARIATWPGAERLVDVEVREVVDRPVGLPLRWELREAHRLNPAVPAADA